MGLREIMVDGAWWVVFDALRGADSGEETGGVLHREEALVAEGSAAVVVAAILSGKLRLKVFPAVLVLTGQNIDRLKFEEIVAAPR